MTIIHNSKALTTQQKNALEKFTERVDTLPTSGIFNLTNNHLKTLLGLRDHVIPAVTGWNKTEIDNFIKLVTEINEGFEGGLGVMNSLMAAIVKAEGYRGPASKERLKELQENCKKAA